MNIQDALSQYKDQIVGGLAGAAIGGGAVGLGTSKSDTETDQEFKNRRLQNALIGAVSGGALGTVGGGVVDSISNAPAAPQPGILSKIKSVIGASINPITNPVARVAESTGAGAGIGRIFDHIAHSKADQSYWSNPEALANFRREAGRASTIAKYPRSLLGAAAGLIGSVAIPGMINHAASQE